MRTILARRNENRSTYRGIFARFGTKRGWQGRQEQTILLTHITDQLGQVVCDHLWFALTTAFAALDLQPGDTVQFDARVRAYEKGYFGHREDVYKPVEVDYKLSHPTRVYKVPSEHATSPVLGGLFDATPVMEE